MSRPPDILLEITAQRRRRLAGGGLGAPMPPSTTGAPLGREQAFLRALAEPGASIIAEVKLGSPSLGDLTDRIEPENQAARYARGGAAALSVVVEPDYFNGSYSLLERCAKASGLPTIAKDFVVDSVQLEWAVEAGASAVLLIAALLDSAELAAYAAAARALGLVPLVETHDVADVARLGDEAWEAVGVNNRDLRSFEVSLEHSVDLVGRLPRSALKVSESGLGSLAEIERLSSAGFDAFLIGESLLTADDPEARLRELAFRDPEAMDQ